MIKENKLTCFSKRDKVMHQNQRADLVFILFIKISP